MSLDKSIVMGEAYTRSVTVKFPRSPESAVYIEEEVRDFLNNTYDGDVISDVDSYEYDEAAMLSDLMDGEGVRDILHFESSEDKDIGDEYQENQEFKKNCYLW